MTVTVCKQAYTKHSWLHFQYVLNITQDRITELGDGTLPGLL